MTYSSSKDNDNLKTKKGTMIKSQNASTDHSDALPTIKNKKDIANGTERGKKSIKDPESQELLFLDLW